MLFMKCQAYYLVRTTWTTYTKWMTQVTQQGGQRIGEEVPPFNYSLRELLLRPYERYWKICRQLPFITGLRHLCRSWSIVLERSHSSFAHIEEDLPILPGFATTSDDANDITLSPGTSSSNTLDNTVCTRQWFTIITVQSLLVGSLRQRSGFRTFRHRRQVVIKQRKWGQCSDESWRSDQVCAIKVSVLTIHCWAWENSSSSLGGNTCRGWSQKTARSIGKFFSRVWTRWRAIQRLFHR